MGDGKEQRIGISREYANSRLEESTIAEIADK